MQIAFAVLEWGLLQMALMFPGYFNGIAPTLRPYKTLLPILLEYILSVSSGNWEIFLEIGNRMTKICTLLI